MCMILNHPLGFILHVSECHRHTLGADSCKLAEIKVLSKLMMKIYRYNVVYMYVIYIISTMARRWLMWRRYMEEYPHNPQQRLITDYTNWP